MLVREIVFFHKRLRRIRVLKLKRLKHLFEKSFGGIKNNVYLCGKLVLILIVKKMKKIFSLVLLALIFGCNSNYVENKEPEEKRPYWVCNCKEQEKVANFVQNGLKPANNMSDEEMEDVISQLNIVAVKSFCRQKMLIIENSFSNGVYIDWKRQKLDSCESVMFPQYGINIY